MSNVTTATFCRYCKSEILNTPKGYPDRCPECFRIIVNPDNKYFKAPKYIYDQKLELINELKMRKLDPDSVDYQEAINDISRAEDEWYRTTVLDNRIASLNDAFCYMQHLLYTKSTPSDIKYLISTAKRIGEIADIIDRLYKTGAAFYDRETKPVRPDTRDDEWDQAAASTGRDS